MTHVSHFNAIQRFALALALVSAVLLGTRLWAQEQGDIETAKTSVGGIVNAAGAPIHSGPTENSYITLKLSKGDHVTVVGAKFDWLKIVPPEGSYCCGGKLFVDRHGDDKAGQGRINKQVNIRAGSDYSAMCSAILCQAAEGTEVTILGEQNEYFKIKPPADAFVYINKQYVDHDTAAPAPPAPTPITGAGHPDPTNNVVPPQPRNDAVVDTTGPGPTTHPGETGGSDVAVATPPTTQPDTNATAQAAEALFAQAQALTSNDKLPESLLRVAEEHLATLKARADAAAKLADVHKQQEELQHRSQALVAEQKELEDRLKNSGVTIYTAVGELRPSSLQFAGATLYRLTDPATGHTFCYLRTNDASVVRNIGQFVGVNGDLGNDAQLGSQVIALKNIAAVDAGKVNNGVVAQLVPPSMMAKTQADLQP